MKKIITLLMAMVMMVPIMRAQNPDYISIAELGMTSKTIPVSDSNQKLMPTSDGVYVGVVTNWQRWNITAGYRKFYTVSGDVMTVYGQSGITNAVQLNLNNGTVEYDLGLQQVTLNEEGYLNSGSCGFLLASQNVTDVLNVQVTIDLNNSKIIFETAPDIPPPTVPTLESVSPESGTTVTTAADGSVTITLTFSAKVVSMEAIVDAQDINDTATNPDWADNISGNADGTVWTLKVPAELVAASIKEDNGLLKVKIQKVFGEGQLQVKFGDNAATDLTLTFPVQGQSTMATLNFVGTSEALSELKVYKSIAVEEEDIQFIDPTDLVSYEGDSYEFSFSNLVRYLFTVPADYKVTVTSDLAQSATTWTLGENHSEKMIVDEEDPDNPKTSYETLLSGPMITVFDPGAKDAVFTVTVKQAVPSTVYISGSFNDNNPGTNSEWAINRDADIYSEDGLNQYPGTIEIPEASSVSFNFSFDNGASFIVPAGGVSVTPEFDNSDYAGTYKYSGSFTVADSGDAKWELSDWQGGDFGVFINWDTQEIAFSYDVELPEVWYIRGEFNDYNPNYNSEWALEPVVGTEGNEENGVYSGEFEIPAGQFSFNLLSNVGTIWLPVSLGETNVYFTSADQSQMTYEDNMEYYFEEGDELIYWVDKNWEGGKVTVTVDSNSGIMTVAVATPSAPEAAYISASFNSNNPNGEAEYMLNKDDEDNTYTGEFPVVQGALSFNFEAGDYYIIPASKANTKVTFSGDATSGSYTGSFILSNDPSLTGMQWEIADWQGGDLSVYINWDDFMMTVAYQQEVEEVWYIRGPFNNWNPALQEEWALNQLEGDENAGIFTGTFEIPDGEFTFNLMDPYGTVYSPCTSSYNLTTVEMEFDKGVYTTNYYDYVDEGQENDFYWTYAEWDGGNVTVTINAQDGSITVEAKSSKVDSFRNMTGNEVIYNLQGVKVDRNKLVPGIYVVDGKKVMIK